MRRGFTMIELVLVVLVVAVVAAIAVPRLATAQTAARLNGAENRLLSEFAAVGELAAAQGRTHTIQLHLGSAELRVFQGTALIRDALVRTVAFGEEPYGVRFVSTNITSGASTIVVDGHGMYSSSAKVQIAYGSDVRVVTLTGPVAGAPITEEEAEAGGDGLLGGLIKGLLGGLLMPARGGGKP
jgi:prepilin-type N-terminal cleavage/methylation domain-containing protein